MSGKKSRIAISAAILVLVAVCLVACNITPKVVISFDTQGGPAVSSVRVAVTDTELELPTPVRKGYVFDGWYADSACSQAVDTSVVPTSDVVFYAKWVKETVRVAFVAEGFATKYVYVPYGDDLTAAGMPTVPEKEGYTGEWNRNIIKNVTEQTTVTAVYTPKIVSVTYYAGGEVYKEYSGLAGDTIEVPDRPTLSGSVFFGWYYDEEYTEMAEEDIKSIPTADIKLYARFIDVTDMNRYITFGTTDDGIVVKGLTPLGKNQSLIVIPDSINGVPVTAIASGTEEEPTVVSSKKFTVVLPASVKRIGAYAFAHSTVAVVSLEEGLEEIAEGAFFGCEELEEIKLPASVKLLGDSAFAGAVKLTNVALADGSCLEQIGNNAFAGDALLTEFTLPGNGLFVMNYASFAGSGISGFLCRDDDEKYIVDDGVVYSRRKDGESFVDYEALVCFPGQKGGAYTIKEDTVEIADGAFYNNNLLTAVTIPASVKTIGKEAFYGCSALVEISFGGDGLESIGEGAFALCGATNITLPSSLNSIGKGAFTCGKWQKVVFSDGENTSPLVLPEEAFSECEDLAAVVFPIRVATIGEKAFFDCVKLSSLTFPTGCSLAEIGDYAFAYCDGLTKVSIPSGVTKIGAYAFYGRENVSVAEPAIPLSVTYIGEYAFANTRVGSYTVNMNTKVGYMGEGAFKNCRNLSQITLPRTTDFSAVPDYAFYGCVSLVSIIFNGNITKIGDYAFYGCTGLTGVTFNQNSTGGVTEIGESAFENCVKLKNGASTSRILPSKLTSLGKRAFYGCSAIEKVTIPNNLSKVSEEAFAKCVSLKEIAYDAECSTDTLGENCFADCTSLSKAALPPKLKLRAEDKGAVKNPFAGCSALVEFSITGSEVLYVEDGVVYAKEGDAVGVYLYPAGKTGEFEISASVDFVDEYAFADTTGLTVIKFSSGAQSEDKRTEVRLTEIRRYAFYASHLTDAEISYRVFTIGEYAFADTKLDTLDIVATGVKDGETFVIKNSSVADSNALSIGDYAFAGTHIEELVLPRRVTKIGEGSFEDCYYLKSLDFEEEYPAQGEELSYGNLAISAGAFRRDTGLTKVALPSHVDKIGAYAFAEAYNMSEIVFASGVEVEIGDYAFASNHYLTKVVLPSGIKSLGEGAFYDDSRLSEIVFPDEITAEGLVIPAYAFAGCYKLLSIEIPEYVTEIGAYAFAGLGLEKLAFAGTSTENELTIGEYAFAYTDSLAEIALPARLVKIGEYAFYNGSLSEVSFAEPADENEIVVEVGDYAFAGTKITAVALSSRFALSGQGIFANTECLETATIAAREGKISDFAFNDSAIAELTVVGEVASIGKMAFYGAHGLSELTIKMTDGEFFIGESAFENSAIKEFLATGEPETIIVDKKAFFNATALTGIALKAGRMEIGDFAFAESGISRLTLETTDSEGVSVIGVGITADADKLEAIDFVDAAENIIAIDGALYLSGEGGEKTLVQYPAGKKGSTVILGEDVTKVADYAFCGNDYLTTVTVAGADAFVEFGQDAFFEAGAGITLYVDETKTSEYSVSGAEVKSLQSGFGGLVLSALGDNRYSVVGYTGEETELDINGKITVGGIDYYIVKIGKNAFRNNASLVEVAIGSGISEIDEYAFAGAVKLQSVVVGNNVSVIKGRAFENCVSLRKVVFGKSVTTISDYAFYGDKDLTSVDFEGSALVTVGNYAFGCCNLSEVKLGDKLVTVGNNAFENNDALIKVIIPASISSIGAYVFGGCDNLSFVFVEAEDRVPTIKATSFGDTPDGLKLFVSSFAENRYKTDSFWRNYYDKLLSYDNISAEEGFENYVLKQNSDGYTLLSYLGTEAEVDLKSDINGKGKITEIGEYAFGHFTETISIGTGVKKIGNNAFRNASALRSVQLSGSEESIGSHAFYNLKNLEKIVFAENSSLRSIGEYAFYRCEGLEEIALPEKLEAIGNYAFFASALSSVKVGSVYTVVMTVGKYAFAQLPELVEIAFDCAVSSLGEGAFAEDVKLKAVYFNSTGSIIAAVDETSTEVFKNCDLLCVYVPTDATLKAYRTTGGWTSQFDKNRLVVSSYIAEDVESESGEVIKSQDGFVISPVASSSVASIISYIGKDTVVAFPSTVQVNGKEYTINKIGREENNSTSVVNGRVISDSVTEIILPSSVTDIGGDAFRGAKNLRKVTCAEDSALSDIGSYAFAYCDKLEEVSLPKYLKSIGSHAFAYDKALKHVTVEELSDYDEESALVIGEYAFTEDEALGAIVFPKHLTVLNEYAFYKCENLTSISFASDGITTTLGKYSFAYTALTDVTLPESVSTVGDYAFAYDEQLRAVRLNRTIKEGFTSLTTAGSYVFRGIDSPFLKVYVPEVSYGQYANAEGWKTKTVIPDLTDYYEERGMIVYGDYNYRLNGSGVVTNNTTVTLTNYLGSETEIVIPAKIRIGAYECRVTTIDSYFGNDKITKITFDKDSTVTNLNEYAFAGCSALKTVIMSDSITGAGDYMFADCVSLVDVTLSENLSKIPAYAFSGCASLLEITVPASVGKTTGETGIGNAAFINCVSLNRLNIQFTEAKAPGMSALSGTSASLVIIVPEGRKDAFANEWTEWSDIIFDETSRYGDFIVKDNSTGVTLVQYNGYLLELDLSGVLIGGKPVTEIKDDAATNGGNIKI